MSEKMKARERNKEGNKWKIDRWLMKERNRKMQEKKQMKENEQDKEWRWKMKERWKWREKK